MKGEEIVVLLLAFVVGFAISQMMGSKLIESEMADVNYFTIGNKDDPCGDNSRLNEFFNNINKQSGGSAENDLYEIANNYPAVDKKLKAQYQHYADFCQNHGKQCLFSPAKNMGCYDPANQPTYPKVNFV
jgi:hypothetical protein